MPRVPVHDLETAPADSRDQLQQLEERYGTILNIHGEMAHAPAVIDLYTSAEAAIDRSSSLERRTRKAIHLAVTDETWRAATDEGWTDTQILEAFADVIRATMTNFFNHLVGTEIDVPRAPGVQ